MPTYNNVCFGVMYNAQPTTQKRRKQLSVKDQLDKWKRSEELSRELVTEASYKLQQRPKSVDPGTFNPFYGGVVYVHCVVPVCVSYLRQSGDVQAG